MPSNVRVTKRTYGRIKVNIKNKKKQTIKNNNASIHIDFYNKFKQPCINVNYEDIFTLNISVYIGIHIITLTLDPLKEM